MIHERWKRAGHCKKAWPPSMFLKLHRPCFWAMKEALRRYWPNLGGGPTLEGNGIRQQMPAFPGRQENTEAE